MGSSYLIIKLNDSVLAPLILTTEVPLDLSRRGVKYLFKSSSIKIDIKVLPEVVSLKEAREYASLHKLRFFKTGRNDNDTWEDPDFDALEATKKRKIEPTQDKCIRLRLI